MKRKIQDKFTREHFGPKFPTFLELFRRSSYLLINTYEFLDIARPMSPKIKFIGGIVTEELTSATKKLDSTTQKIFGIF